MIVEVSFFIFLFLFTKWLSYAILFFFFFLFLRPNSFCLTFFLSFSISFPSEIFHAFSFCFSCTTSLSCAFTRKGHNCCWHLHIYYKTFRSLAFANTNCFQFSGLHYNIYIMKLFKRNCPFFERSTWPWNSIYFYFYKIYKKMQGHYIYKICQFFINMKLVPWRILHFFLFPNIY